MSVPACGNLFSVAFACEPFAAAAGVVEVVPALTLLFKATTWASLALAAAEVVFTSFEAFFAGAITLTSVVLVFEPSFLVTGVLVSEVVFDEVV